MEEWVGELGRGGVIDLGWAKRLDRYTKPRWQLQVLYILTRAEWILACF
jgi:hypothetical protein